MKTYFDNIFARTCAVLIFILLVTCAVTVKKPDTEPTNTGPEITQDIRPYLAGTYKCPPNMSKLCEAYRTIQTQYIRRIPDNELTNMFIVGISRKIRETDPSKSSSVKIRPASFTCSKDIQRLCDAYDTFQNQYGKKIPDKHLTEMFINGWISIINETDPYSQYISNVEDNINYFQYPGIGLDIHKEEVFPFQMIVRVAKEYNPAFLAGIRRGDRITHVNGISISNWSAKETINRIRGKVGTPVRLTVISGCSEKQKEITIIRKEVRDVMSGVVKMLGGRYGYIRLAEFNDGTMITIRTSIEKFEQKFGRIRGLILDLRNNPGGSTLEASKLLGLFIGKGPAFYYVRQNGTYASWDIRTDGTDILQGRPIVVLVNNDSASSSEITAGAFQYYKRATIIGTDTYRKGCFQTTEHMKDKSLLVLTEAYTFTPDKNAINKIGIRPDVVVPEGKNESCTGDEQLAAAVRILDKKGG